MKTVHRSISFFAAFSLLASACSQVPTVWFTNNDLTGFPNQTTLNIKAANNPSVGGGTFYSLMLKGTNIPVVDGVASIRLLPNDYTCAYAGIPQTFVIHVTNSSTDLNAADLQTNLVRYTGVQTLQGLGSITIIPPTGAGGAWGVSNNPDAGSGTNGGSGEVNTIGNVGTGLGLAGGKSGTQLNVKSIAVTGGATITSNNTTLTISADAAGAAAAVQTSLNALSNSLGSAAYQSSTSYEPAGSSLLTSNGAVAFASSNTFFTAVRQTAVTNFGSISLVRSVPYSATHATIKVNGKLYAGGDSGGIFVINNPDDDLSSITSTSLPPTFAACYLTNTSRIYFVGTNAVIAVNPANITSQATIVSGIPFGQACIATDQTNIFVGAYGTNWIYKFSTSGTLLASNTWAAGIHSAAWDQTHGVLVFTSTGGAIAKVNPSTLAVTSATIGGLPTDDFAIIGNSIYVGSETDTKMRTVNFSDLSCVTNAADRSYGVFTDGTNLFNLSRDGLFVFYPNADLTQPYKFAVGIQPNELWITDGGRYIVSDFSDSVVYRMDVTLGMLGKGVASPAHNLDVRGDFSADAATLYTLKVSGGITGNNYLLDRNGRQYALSLALNGTGESGASPLVIDTLGDQTAAGGISLYDSANDGGAAIYLSNSGQTLNIGDEINFSFSDVVIHKPLTADSFSGALNGSQISSGTVNPDRLGSGGGSGKFLGYDSAWHTISGGGDMLKANNLSDVASASTALANIGGNNAANLSTGTLPQGRLPAVVVTNSGAFTAGALLKASGAGSYATSATPGTDYLAPSNVPPASLYGAFSNGLSWSGGDIPRYAGYSDTNGSPVFTNAPYPTGTAGNGTASLPETNYFNVNTNAVVVDCSKVQAFGLRLLTNCGGVVFTNASYLTNYHDRSFTLFTWEDTNGTWSVGPITVAKGLVRTNGTAVRGTNANQYDALVCRLDGTGTNLAVMWETNWLPSVSFTNSLAAGGGGGGGGSGTFTLIDHAITNAATTSTATLQLSTVGANFLVVYVANYNSGSPDTGPAHGTDTFTACNIYGDGATGVRSNQFYYVNNPEQSATYQITAKRNILVIGAQSYSYSGGGTPTLDTQNGVGSNNFTTLQPGSVTYSGASTGLCVAGVVWDAAKTLSSIGSSFTIRDQMQQGGNSLMAAMADKATATSENPLWTMSGGTVGASAIVMFK